jgi:chromosome segregation ATPase
MLEQRVATLERAFERVGAKLDRVDEALRRIETALRDLASDNKEMRRQMSDLTIKVATIEGQLKNIPTTLQLFLALISTWAAGAAIVFALLKATHP